MVLEVPRAMVGDHAAMYAFDLNQQFGLFPPAVAAVGLGWLFRTDWRRGALVSTSRAAICCFAFSYNVGDTHVFYLPSHLIALLAAPGIVLMVIGLRQRTLPRSAADAAPIRSGQERTTIRRSIAATTRRPRGPGAALTGGSTIATPSS